MNPVTKLIFASALLLSTTIGLAQAQQTNDAPPPAAEQMDDGPDGGHDDGHRGKRHHGGPGERGGRQMLIDVNADGIINDDEAAVLADHAFNRMDENRDGSLTETEFTTPRGHRGGWFNWGNSDETAAVLKVRKDKFATLDTDKNATINKVEFFADAKAKLAAADTDKDGKVTPWEFRAQN